MSKVILSRGGEPINLDVNNTTTVATNTTIEQNTDKTENTEQLKQPEKKHKENAITIDKLIDGYSKRTSIKMKEEYLKAVIKVKPYVSYGVKMVLADMVIKNSCLKDGRVHIDSCKKYILYIYALIDTYTNIEITEKQWLFEYDRLDSIGLIEPILALIPEKEVATFKTILDMKHNDLMTNRYGTYAFIEDQVNRIVSVTPEISKAFAPLIEKLNEKLETLDESKIEKMLNKAVRLIK